MKEENYTIAPSILYEPYSKKRINQKYDMHKISRIRIGQDEKTRLKSDY